MKQIMQVEDLAKLTRDKDGLSALFKTFKKEKRKADWEKKTGNQQGRAVNC